MCGIAGIYLKKKLVEIKQLKLMTDAIAHRGPDGEGHWINENACIGLGHRRLSILDLSERGKQPMHYLNERYSITFNGEIYNYIELKKELTKAGYNFHSDTDTEVLLALYHQQKEKCLPMLNGMFAFAIWDEKMQTLFCARDRFGEKPFYYTTDSNNNFIFSSEMKSLWAIGIQKHFNSKKVEGFLNNAPLLDGDNLTTTFFDNIFQLDAGHYLLLRNDFFITQKKYYSIDTITQKENISINEATNELFSLFENSVKLRLRADVPVGSSLSGGIDSSSIVKMIEKLKPENYFQNTFSARFQNFAKDEGDHIATIVNSVKNIKAFEVWPKAEDMFSEIDKILYHQEEPFNSGSIFAQWKVMELAKKNNVIVLLDGQGADEYFAGYTHYFTTYCNQLFYTNHSLYKKEVLLYNTLRNNVEKIETREKNIRQKISYCKNKILRNNTNYGEIDLQQRLMNDTMSNGLKVLLRFADRNSMAHSIEIRLPFLDHHLVEFIFSLPDNFKLKDGMTKWILRNAMKRILPQSIVNRVDKVGYEVPQNVWLENIVNDNMKNIVRQYLNDNNIQHYEKNEITTWNYYMMNKLIN